MSLLHPLRDRVLVEPTAHFHTAEVFLPGAGGEVYEPYFNHEPIVSMIGAATECGPAPSPFGAPPVYVPAPLGIVSGVHNELGDFLSTGLAEV